jgi:hypothetical protein
MIGVLVRIAVAASGRWESGNPAVWDFHLSTTLWVLGFRSEETDSSSALWECGNRGVRDFQGAVGTVENRLWVFHGFHGPGISTALRIWRRHGNTLLFIAASGT